MKHRTPHEGNSGPLLCLNMFSSPDISRAGPGLLLSGMLPYLAFGIFFAETHS